MRQMTDLAVVPLKLSLAERFTFVPHASYIRA